MIFGFCCHFSHSRAVRSRHGWIIRQGVCHLRLFSDGELLVIATVIAAAVIEDLLFDFSGRGEVRRATSKAVLCAFSLVVVVASVLMFGLVTLDNQNRSDAVQQAQSTELLRADQAAQLLAEAHQDQSQSAAFTVEAGQLNRALQRTRDKVLAQAEGIGGTPPGSGPLVFAGEQQVRELQAQASSDSQGAATLANKAGDERLTASRTLALSITNLSIGRRQAAIMSVTMFLISCITGAVALFYSTSESARPEETASPRHVPDAPSAAPDTATAPVLAEPHTPNAEPATGTT